MDPTKRDSMVGRLLALGAPGDTKLHALQACSLRCEYDPYNQ